MTLRRACAVLKTPRPKAGWGRGGRSCWPGSTACSVGRTAPDFWPESLDAISGLTGQEALVLLHYGHIKLVHDGRGFKDSKAYVYSTYGFAR